MKQGHKLISLLIVLATLLSLCVPSLATTPDVETEVENTETIYTTLPILGGKNATLVDKETNRYRVKVSVPGEDPEIVHNELILMLDASDSQGSNWTSVKESVMFIGETVLPQTIDNPARATIAITLMGFGCSGKTVLQDIYSVEELEKQLNALPTNDAFLNGQSATNCEVGFTHIENYITEHEDKIKEAFVIYVSDAKSNTSEEPVRYQDWPSNPSWWFSYKSLEAIAKAIFTGCKVQGHTYDGELKRILNGQDPLNATVSVFNLTRENIITQYLTKDLVDNKIASLDTTDTNAQTTWANIASRFTLGIDNEYHYQYTDTTTEELNLLSELLLSDFNNLSATIWADLSTEKETIDLKTNTITTRPLWETWVDTICSDIYAFSDLDYQNGEHSYATVEKAYLDYDRTYCGHKARWDEHASLFFYFGTLNYANIDKYSNPKNWGVRAAAAADHLATIDKVNSMYLIGYGSAANDSWMNPNRATKYETGNYVTANNIQFLQSSSMASIGDALKNIVPNIVITIHNNVTITDYMSKWVSLDLNSICIYKEDTCICKYIYDPETGDGYNEWTIPEEERPTSQPPISVYIVKREEYARGGENVEGNQYGDIYKIIWQVKDGHILLTDKYSLVYDVLIENEEPGYDPSQTYTTNGNTTATYTTITGEVVNEVIAVPSITVDPEYQRPAPIITMDNKTGIISVPANTEVSTDNGNTWTTVTGTSINANNYPHATIIQVRYPATTDHPNPSYNATITISRNEAPVVEYNSKQEIITVPTGTEYSTNGGYTWVTTTGTSINTSNFVSGTNVSIRYAGTTETIASQNAIVTIAARKNINVKITNYAKNQTTYTTPTFGWTEGRNYFTVTGPDACRVILNRMGSYTELACTTEDNLTHVFSGDLKNNDEIMIIMIGDADLDGYITITDMARINQYLVGIYDFNHTNYIASDVDNDTFITITDIARINQHLVGIHKFQWNIIS